MSASMSNVVGYAVMSPEAWRKTLSYGMEMSTMCHFTLHEAVYEACRLNTRKLAVSISDGNVPNKKREREPQARPVMEMLVKTKFIVVRAHMRVEPCVHQLRTSTSNSAHVLWKPPCTKRPCPLPRHSFQHGCRREPVGRSTRLQTRWFVTTAHA